jgi:cell division protein FtsN
MKSPGKFFSAFTLFVLVMAGLFFSWTKALQFYADRQNISFQKTISSKPSNIKDKQPFVESDTSTSDAFTFFDTLDDPSMKKYIGLNGTTVTLKEEDNYRSSDLTLRVKKKPAPRNSLAVSKNIRASNTIDIKNKKKTDSSIPGFVLQVGSFQDLSRADTLKEKLTKSDYSVFISSTWIEEKGRPLHRVFVGTFFRKKDAEKIAIEIKESQKIEPLIKFYEKKG